MPWARSVETRLATTARVLDRLGISVSDMPNADRTVFAEFSLGQNIVLGTSGRVEPTVPASVLYASSTGLFEVTVSLAGLVRDGAILGASFEAAVHPYEITYDLPRDGVTMSAPIGQTAWSAFSQSYSTVISTRPGSHNLALYFYGVCTAGAASAAFVKRARLTVKAV